MNTFTLEEIEAIITARQPTERPPEHNPGGIYIADTARFNLCEELLEAFRDADPQPVST